ncbi:MAG: hypothetical protein GF335_02910 [Candidatus Moranbacteria bacterium]|nr:hypothetical protein [Candidatus Moranbacteria bacterium]
MLNYLKFSKDVLGMNSRNLDYIRSFNKKRAKETADHKLNSKKILKKNGLKVPDLIGKIETFKDVENFDWEKLPKSFVLKPNRGLGGEGIMVVYGKKKNGNWVKSDRQEVSIQDLKNHILNILEGNYSISGVVDSAFFEERVKILKLFKQYSYRGIPDIRVIVFNNTPVMAMLRLPTKESGGRANLHLGGICVGIDLNTGVTTTAITRNLATQQEFLIDQIPFTRLSLSGISMPCWKEILEMSVKAQQVTGIGFLGVDIMVDRDKGPVIAELNARPGLAIQIANLAALKYRLKKVEGLKINTVKKGVRVGRDLFGGEIEEDIEDMTGKKVIGIFEKVTLKNIKSGVSKEENAKIDTGAFSTSISTDLAKKMGYDEVVKIFDSYDSKAQIRLTLEQAKKLTRELKEKYLDKYDVLTNILIVKSSNGITVRPKIKIKIYIENEIIDSHATVHDRKDLKYKVIIGRQDLKNLIVDPSRIKRKNL